MTLGEIIKKQRKSKKMSREELGRSIGRSQYSIKDYELDETIPSLVIIKKLSEVLDTDLLKYLDSTEILENNEIHIAKIGEETFNKFKEMGMSFGSKKSPYSLFKEYMKTEDENAFSTLSERELEEIYKQTSDYISYCIFKIIVNKKKIEENSEK